MLVSHRKRFIYTKTAKTAGTSVEVYFEKYCMPEGEWIFSHEREQYVSSDGIIGCRSSDPKANKYYNHMSAADIKERIGTSTWDKYFKFCVIRNPFDRLLSLYFFQIKIGAITVKKNENPVEGFQRFIQHGVPVPDTKQYMINSKICMDYFIRFEDLKNGIKFVCNRLNLPFEPERIPKLKTGIRGRSIPIGNFYTKEVKQLVEKAYETEIGEFGYSFPA